MKNEIVKIEHVPFMGADLLAAQDNAGNIWAGINYICRGIGLSEDQMKNERKKIQSDIVLSEGGSNLTLPTSGGNQEALCLRLDFVPLWLAKISITPAMKEEKPELAERLKQYQLHAKDVLAAAFLPEHSQADYNGLSPELQMLKLLIDKAASAELEQKRQAAAIESVENKVDGIRELVVLNPQSWREECRRILAQIAQSRGGGGAYQEVNAEVYTLVDERAGVSLAARLTNKRRRMADEGVCKSKREKLNKVDVIAEDKKLIEIYIAVVKEMAVKYGVAADRKPV